MRTVINLWRGIFYYVQRIRSARKVVFNGDVECFESLMVEKLSGDCCDNILCETTNVKPKITRGKRYEILNTSSEGFCILDDNRSHVTFSWFRSGWKLTTL